MAYAGVLPEFQKLDIYTASDSEATPMLRDPLTLIDQSIENLRTLVELFADEAGERLPAAPMTPEARLCKEAALTIRVLLPKLQAARQTQVTASLPRAYRQCVHCED